MLRLPIAYFGEQYRDTGWFEMLLMAVFVAFLLFNIFRARAGASMNIRRIAGLNAIEEAVGRATEMGRPIVMVPGLSDPVDAIAMQALSIFSFVIRMAAKFATPIYLCNVSATVYTVAQEVVRDVYQQAGYPERYDIDSVRFISDRQFAFAAGVSGIILREKAAACFFLGAFYAESLIFAETANGIGAIQVASSTEQTQTPFFIAACDYVLIGDEFYAASAYLTRQPVLIGSLIGQDWCKLVVAALVVLGALNVSLTSSGMVTRQFKAGIWQTIPARQGEPKDSFFDHLFTPTPRKVTVTRPMDTASSTGGGQ